MVVNKTLTEFIKEEEGYIFSDGTLHLEHLLPKAYDLMVQYGLKEELRKEILSLFLLENEDYEEQDSLFVEQFYSRLHLKDEKEIDANAIWNEDVYNFFSEISPDGYYFGSADGDGALIGWFKAEDEDNLCPVCNVNELDEDEAMNALSRKDNDTYICSDCARNEAMEEFNKHFGE